MQSARLWFADVQIYFSFLLEIQVFLLVQQRIIKAVTLFKLPKIGRKASRQIIFFVFRLFLSAHIEVNIPGWMVFSSKTWKPFQRINEKGNLVFCGHENANFSQQEKRGHLKTILQSFPSTFFFEDTRNWTSEWSEWLEAFRTPCYLLECFYVHKGLSVSDVTCWVNWSFT